MNFASPNSSIFALNRTVVWLIIFGIILLLGVILLSGNINETIAAQAATPPAVAATAAQSTTTVQFQPTTLNDMQSILNHPANFRIIPKDIPPVQAFVEGKTTKFIMGL